MTVYASYPQNGTAPRERIATLIRSTRLATAPIATRSGTDTLPLHVHDVDVTLPAGYEPSRLTWDQWHTSYGAVIRTHEPLFERCRFHQLGDGISVQGSRWEVRDCWFDDLYDDAIEADSLTPGVIDGCVMDGVHIGLSARNANITAAAGAVITVRRTAIRLRPQEHSYKPEKYGPNRHGPFFKMQPTSPHVLLDDVTLAASQPSAYGGTLGPPPSCIGTVTLIGTEAWPAADVAAWEQSPVTVRYGTWDDWARIVSTPHPAHP